MEVHCKLVHVFKTHFGNSSVITVTKYIRSRKPTVTNIHLLIILYIYPSYEYTFRVLQSNEEIREHQQYFWNVIVLQEISQSGVRKVNLKQER